MILKTDWLAHLHKIRKIEVDKAFGFLDRKKFESGLEMGAGDGYQTSIIAPMFKEFISSDLNFERIKIKTPGVKYIKVDADNFKDIFPENKFDVIFSSSFLEHLSKPEDFLINSRRCLKKDGYAIHIVPNRYMKIAYILMFYPNLLLIILDRLVGLFKGKKIFRGYNNKFENNINSDNLNIDVKNKYSKILLPSVHGMYKSHYDEFLRWGRSYWDRMFKDSGYKIIKEIGTSAHSGYGFGLDSIRGILTKFGITSLTIYILQKNG